MARHFPITAEEEATVGPPPLSQTAAHPLARKDEPDEVEMFLEEAIQDGSEEDRDNGRGPGELDEEDDPYSLPISHEVALEGAQPTRLEGLLRSWRTSSSQP